MKNRIRVLKNYEYQGSMYNLESNISSLEQYRWKIYFIDSDKKGDLLYRVSAMISIGTFCGMGLCSGISALLKLRSVEENRQEIHLVTKFRWEWILFALVYVIIFILLEKNAFVDVLFKVRDLILIIALLFILYRIQDYLLIKKIEKVLNL